MALETTLDPILQPMMDGPTIKSDRCVICGAIHPLEQHHPVRRGAGQFVRDGKVVPKPTLTLCGHGNIRGMGGRPCCHGLAHHNMLHFRFNLETDQWEYARFSEPIKYLEALKADNWYPLPYYKFRHFM